MKTTRPRRDQASQVQANQVQASQVQASSIEHRRHRRSSAWVLGPLGAVALLVAAPAVAQAHIELGADTTAAGSVALLSLNVPHGCEGAATTAVVVRIPAGVVGVTPTVNPGWTISKKTSKLAEPVTDDDGETITTRVSEVSWTARTPLPDGYRDALSMQVLLPADAAGQQLVFPTIQRCGSTEVGWTQVPAPGQDDEELEHPAPTVVVTAAEAAGDHHGHEAAPEPEPSAEATPAPGAAASTTGTPSSSTGVAGLVLGGLGLAAGLTALVRTRRRG